MGEVKKRKIKAPKKVGRVSKAKIRKAVKKVKEHREIHKEMLKGMLYIHYINEFDYILDLDISGSYKVIILKQRIKDLREDPRFD